MELYWDHKQNRSYKRQDRSHVKGIKVDVVELIPEKGSRLQFSARYFNELVEKGSIERVNQKRLLELQIMAQKLHLH